MAPSDLSNLEELRTDILGKLTSMGDQLTDNDAVGFEALMTIARASGSTELLAKALAKVDGLESPDLKVDALLDLLDEVNLRLSQAGPQASDAQGADEIDDEAETDSQPATEAS